MTSDPDPIRVLYYEHPGPGLGGSRRSLLNLIRGLGEPVQPHIVAELPEEVLYDLPEAAVVFPTSRFWPPRGPVPLGRIALTARWFWYMVTMVLRLLWIILRWRIDLVHANNEVTANAPAILAAKLARRPCICHLRGTQRPLRETRWLFRHVTHYIAISDYVRKYYAQRGLLRGRPTSIIYNGIDVEATRQRSTPHSFEKDTVFRVGMFARMIEFKGHRHFLQVAREVLGLEPGIRFVIHGPIPGPGDAGWAYYGSVCKTIKAMGLDDHIRFDGPYSDVGKVMQETNVVLACSPYDNFGRILFESMACGVPVVAFDTGGIREVAVHGENCLLVPNRDVRAMAEALVRLSGDPDLRQRLVRGGRETARRLFDRNRNAAQVLAIYCRLIGAGRRPNLASGTSEITPEAG